MKKKQKEKNLPQSPPLVFLRRVEKYAREKKLWEFADSLYKEKDKWPAYVFLPFGAWYAVACVYYKKMRLDIEDLQILWELAIAGTWRLTQDIVRFDPDTYESLIDTSIEGNIPFDVLRRMPAWCTYVETIDLVLTFNGERFFIKGFWALLEHNIENSNEELRLFFLCDTGFIIPGILQIDDNTTIDEAVRKIYTQDIEENRIDALSVQRIIHEQKDLSYAIHLAINLLLYICAYGFGQKTESSPAKGVYIKKTGGFRTESARQHTVRRMGTEFGEALRKEKETRKNQDERREEGKTRAAVRPHIRRAHWHTFWTGKRNPDGSHENRKCIVKWLPPIPVAMNTMDDD